jgi:flagella basal body P-ring formation protein FlgA
VRSEQLQGQLQTQHSVDTGNYIKEKQNIKTGDKLQASTGERKHINTENVNKQNKDENKCTENIINKNYITQTH